MPTNVKIAASVLSADLARLADEIRDADAAGADWIHVDIMDGCFVPNLTLGPPVLAWARQATSLPIDVHLMVERPEQYIGAFAEAGADLITVHVEGTVHLQRALGEIRRLGKRAGVVLNPHTPEDCLRYLLDDLDLVLLMTVNPGFGGQHFLPAVLPKIEAVRALIDRAGLPIELEVDGGVAPDTARRVVEAGARVLVAGSAVFGQKDRRAAIRALREQAELAG